MGELIKKFPKQQFLDLLSSGLTEPEALSQLDTEKNVPRPFPSATYTLLLVKDAEFREMVEEAKKRRADVWFSEIIQSTRNKTITKEDVPAEKLKFEQRKYLAAIDNPDKYGERVKHQHDVHVNIFQEMKDLPVAEARRILQTADPFALPIDVEFTNVTPDTPSKPDQPIDTEKYDTTEPMVLEEEDIFS